MDSGNSGSLQSSSGGDDEYDSRAAAPFMTNTRPPPIFDPLPNYLQLHRNPNPPWPITQRSDPNPNTHFFQPPPSAAVGPENNNNNNNNINKNSTQTAARNPKKRSRASRRAPTTVLTTDTTNFRAMVQEFTGIPAPPFTSSSFTRPRLDLLNAPPYLRRPFAQKAQSPPFLASTSSNFLTSSSTALNDVVPPITQNNNSNIIFNNIPNNNPLFFSSLLQTNPKFLLSDQIPFNDHSNIKMDGLDEFGLGHGRGNHVTGLPNLISPDNNQIGARNDNHNGNEDEEVHDYRGYNFSSNYSTGNGDSTVNRVQQTNFRDPENVATRSGEGMLESWITSSELK